MRESSKKVSAVIAIPYTVSDIFRCSIAPLAHNSAIIYSCPTPSPHISRATSTRERHSRLSSCALSTRLSTRCQTDCHDNMETTHQINYPIWQRHSRISCYKPSDSQMFHFRVVDSLPAPTIKIKNHLAVVIASQWSPLPRKVLCTTKYSSLQ